MARRQPTAEQKQKAAERRERFRVLAKKIGELPDDERLALAARAGIRTIEGRELSPVNQCLLIHQRPNVTVVGGFQQWKRAGRQVRKGESGLSIWVPVGFAKGSDDGTQPIEGDGEGKRAGFIMGTVFDITQTDPADERGPDTRAADYRTSGIEDGAPGPESMRQLFKIG